MKAPPQRMPVPSSLVGASCVVNASEVEQRSQSGWKLAMVVHSQELQTPPSPNGHHSYCTCYDCQEPGKPRALRPAVLVDVPRFVMFRGAEDEVARAKGEAEKWRIERDNAAKDWQAAEHKLRAVEKARDDLKEKVDNLQSGLEAAQRAANARVQQTQKLEQDLAKVRREIGEAAWKRIVEAAS